MKKTMSRTQRALEWLEANRGHTPYAAARKFELNPSVLYRAIAARAGRSRCPNCGQLLPKR